MLIATSECCANTALTLVFLVKAYMLRRKLELCCDLMGRSVDGTAIS